jgi:glucose-1-phosphate cytidylyltransferase
MKVIILAGSYGPRIAEESEQKPKPLVTIGNRPLLWHIMKTYSTQGFNEFIIALGDKGYLIQEYFANHIEWRTNEISPDWRIHSIDTGLDAGTGGRLKKLAPLIENGTFMMTYGDGLANVDIAKLLKFHQSHGKLATITVVHPPVRARRLHLEGDRVAQFVEKPPLTQEWVNGGFFVLEPKVFDYIDGEQTMFEQEPLTRLANDNQLMAYRHDAFWHCVDTLKDMRMLERVWTKGKAPWKIWSE